MAINTNLIHNILNFIMILAPSLLIATGCEQVGGGMAGDLLDCSKSWLDPKLVAYITAGSGLAKIAMNVFRDGFTGLWKAQLPVRADATVASAGTVKSGPNVSNPAPTTKKK